MNRRYYTKNDSTKLKTALVRLDDISKVVQKSFYSSMECITAETTPCIFYFIFTFLCHYYKIIGLKAMKRKGKSRKRRRAGKDTIPDESQQERLHKAG